MTVSGALVVVAVVAAVNPARIAHAARTAPAGAEVRSAVAGGVGLAGVTAAVLALVGAAAWEWLDVSEPTGVLAAGLVIVLAGAWTALVRLPTWEPALGGVRAALLPVAVPLALRPEVALLALAAGADGHVPAVVLGLVLAGGIAVLGTVASGRPDGPADRAWAWGSRATGAVALAAGIALAVAGVFSV